MNSYERCNVENILFKRNYVVCVVWSVGEFGVWGASV